MANLKEHVFKEIIENIKDISYGTLLITIHNDEITQLDVTKKKRFNLVKTSQSNIKAVQ